MAGEKTIEIISRHTGTVNVKVKGEPRKIEFKEARPGVGVALVDHDEAAVLLIPELKNDFWKEGVIEVEADKEKEKPNGEGGEGKGGSAAKPPQPEKANVLIERIKAAATLEEVDTILGDDKRPSVVSAAEVRKEELKEAAEKKD